MRTFTVHVYRWSLGDCSNGGVTSRLNSLRVMANAPIYGPHDVLPTPKADAPADLFVQQHRGGEYWALIPLRSPGAGYIGPMFGGTLATTSNALNNPNTARVWHVHDRFESPATYNLNAD